MIITPKEWKLVALIAVLTLFFSQIPLIVGYMAQDDGEVFMGIPVHVTDANNHLNWALQAKEGKILFSNDFTSEDIPPLIFNPFHLLVGNLSRSTGISLIGSYNLIGMIFIVAFVFILYLFISLFSGSVETRMLALVISLSASGLGAFWKLSKAVFGKWIVSSELWITELNTFQSFGNPHFVLSMILMLLVFYFFLRSYFEKRWAFTCYSGLFLAILVMVHIFDVVTIVFVLAGWFVYECSVKRKILWDLFMKMFLIGAFAIPFVGYYFWVFFIVPSYKAWNSLNQTVTPDPLSLLSGLGLLVVLTLITIFSKKYRFASKERQVFLLVWIVADLLLVYLPLNVQRRFLLGIHIPFSILATFAVVDIVVPFVKKHLSGGKFFNRRLVLSKGFLYLVIVLLLSVTSIYLLADQVASLHDVPSGEFGNVRYLSDDEFNAILWLDEHTNNSDVIIAPYHLSNFIPSFAGNKVYCGHWAQTLNFSSKYDSLNDFYGSLEGGRGPDSDLLLGLDDSRKYYYFDEKQGIFKRLILDGRGVD